MKYLLDTNILSYLEEQASPFHVSTKAAFARLGDDDEVCIPILILYELRYSVSAATPEKAKRLTILIQSYLQQFPIQHLTEDGADVFGELKTQYRQKRPGLTTNILNRHNIDFILASSAIAEDAVLVSNDKIFEELREINPALQLENWAAG